MSVRYIVNRLRREVDQQREARKGTMQAGMPKVRLYESDVTYALNLLEALEPYEEQLRSESTESGSG